MGMLSSTRDIAPSCVGNVDELIERQEKSLSQLETKRAVVKELIAKGKQLLENPDKPKFLDSHVSRIEVGWDDTKDKAQSRLTLLQNTKDAWVGFADGSEQIVVEFEKGDEEIKKIKKRFNLAAAFEDLEKRQKIHGDIKNNSDKMTPEDRVSYTMELQEDVAAKVEIIKANIAGEVELLPQGEKVPQDAQDYKDELKRIETFVLDLQKKVMKECDNFSEDVKYWAEYKTGIKSFRPWLEAAEAKSTEGLSKPQTLEEADDEVAGLKTRYEKVKAVSDEWMKKVDTLVKEWKLLDNTVTELNSWVAKDRGAEGEQQFSLEKMESTLGELKNIFKEKEKLVDNL